MTAGRDACQGGGAGGERGAVKPGGAAVRVEGLTYQVGERRLVDQVSLEVASGELVALVGPNGAGKSTLLGLLSGDLCPSEGSVLLLGRPATGDLAELARSRALLRQRSRVAFEYSAAEVVRMGRAPHGESAAASWTAAARAMAATDTVQLAGRSMDTLSGGELALVSLARVLAQEAPILMLDEPTAALDLRHQHLVLSIARRQADSGCAVIVVLHDLTLATGYADRVGVLHGGRLAALGSPADTVTPRLVCDVFQHPVDVLPHPVDGHPVVLARRLGSVPSPNGDASPDLVESPTPRGDLS